MQQQRQYVGIDLHRRRSVIVRMTEDGEVLDTVRIVNDAVALSLELAKAGPDPEVALEACYGWYWAADLLEADGAHVHLVHPLGLHWDTRRVKNDERDATELAHRLRRGDLPESWIAHWSCVSSVSSFATGPSSRRYAPQPRRRYTR